MPLESLVSTAHALHPLPPISLWEEPPPPPRPLPPTLWSLEEAIPKDTLRRTLIQLRAIDACISFAMKGDVCAAMLARPRPLVIHEHALFTPKAKGYGVLDLRPLLEKRGPIGQLLPSRFPERPPNSDLVASFFLWFADLFPDLQSVSYAVNGMPDHSCMPLTLVLCPPAISAIKAIATFVECTDEDEALGFTSKPFPFCPTWPFIGDSCSVHWRNDKPRLCWDKSGPRQIPSFIPFNDSLPLDDLPIIVYVTIRTSTREMAIFASSGFECRMWKADLSKAYRRGGAGGDSAGGGSAGGGTAGGGRLSAVGWWRLGWRRCGWRRLGWRRCGWRRLGWWRLGWRRLCRW